MHRQAAQKHQHNIPLHHSQHVDTVTVHIHQDSAQHMVRQCMECNKVGHFHRVSRSKKTRAVNELGQEIMQENTGEDFEMVSINSVYFNKNHWSTDCKFKAIIR